VPVVHTPQSGAVQVDGFVEPGFEKVAGAFVENFTIGGDTGAACAVYLAGAPVVDLWAGASERGPWTRGTRSVMFSVSKGITTVLVLMAAERGDLDLDAPVASYWPEFAAAGKQTVTVRQVLAHQAGLVAPEQDLTVADLVAWDPVTHVLAEQAPLWRPGTAFAYHAITVGFLAGEILRRATGKRPAQWLHDHVNKPLGLDMTYGGDPADPDLAPIGDPLPDRDTAAAAALTAALDDPLHARIMGMGGAFNGLDLFRTANTSGFLGHESPAANLVTDARSVARFYAATVGEVDGVRLLGPETVLDARREQSAGQPFVGPFDVARWGTGFMINSPRREMLAPAASATTAPAANSASRTSNWRSGSATKPSDLEESRTTAPRPCVALSAPPSDHPSHATGLYRNARHHPIENRDHARRPDPGTAASQPSPMPAEIDDFHAYRAEAGEGADAVADRVPEPAPEGAERRQVRIPVDGGSVDLHIYAPSSPGLHPSIYLHGGGWIAGWARGACQCRIPCGMAAAGSRTHPASPWRVPQPDLPPR
jgi:CubicO group peptidase (beta-lactamase class C family)